MEHDVKPSPDVATVHNHATASGKIWLANMAASLVVVIAIAMGYCYWRFKNIENITSYIQGKSLAVARPQASFGTANKETNPCVEVPIANLTLAPLEVVGARVSCTCLEVQNVPFGLPPGETRSLKIKVLTGRKIGKVEEKVAIYTNSPSQPQLFIKVIGFVRTPNFSN